MVEISGGGRDTIAISLDNDFFIEILNNMYSPGNIYFKIIEILYQ